MSFKSITSPSLIFSSNVATTKISASDNRRMLRLAVESIIYRYSQAIVRSSVSLTENRRFVDQLRHIKHKYFWGVNTYRVDHLTSWYWSYAVKYRLDEFFWARRIQVAHITKERKCIQSVRKMAESQRTQTQLPVVFIPIYSSIFYLQASVFLLPISLEGNRDTTVDVGVEKVGKILSKLTSMAKNFPDNTRRKEKKSTRLQLRMRRPIRDVTLADRWPSFSRAQFFVRDLSNTFQYWQWTKGRAKHSRSFVILQKRVSACSLKRHKA